MKFKTRIAFAFFCLLTVIYMYGNSTEKNKWLLSFEEASVPDFITGMDSQVAT